MKRKILPLALTLCLTGLSNISNASKPNAECVEVQATGQTNMSDWQNFKKEQEEKIKINEEHIAKLRKAQSKPEQAMDAAYQKEIDRLQKKNEELRTKIVNYKYDEGKWAQFKREFSHDMDELGKAIKNIGKDNVK